MRSEPLTLTWKAGDQEGTSILEVAGPLIMNNLFSFQEEVARVKPQVLIIDLSGSPYMDSAGLGSLLNTYVSTEKRGGKFLLSGVNERIYALLETTKVHVLLKPFPTVKAAQESLPSN
jgi:anti-sigma B factor antagonist